MEQGKDPVVMQHGSYLSDTLQFLVQSPLLFILPSTRILSPSITLSNTLRLILFFSSSLLLFFSPSLLLCHLFFSPSLILSLTLSYLTFTPTLNVSDAEEFLNVLTNSLKEGLASVAGSLAPGQGSSSSSPTYLFISSPFLSSLTSNNSDTFFPSVFVDYDSLLGVSVEEQQVCQETPDEPPMRKTGTIRIIRTLHPC